MSIREVRLMGDPVLREPALPIARVDEALRLLIADMFETMYAQDGVGLAAPQVGVRQRVIVIDAREDETKPFALINPRITWLSDDLDRAEEGCLSIPGLKEIVERPFAVRVEGLDHDGEPLNIEATALLARILQHEIDHLDGVLFIDRLSPLKRRMLLKKWQKVKP